MQWASDENDAIPPLYISYTNPNFVKVKIRDGQALLQRGEDASRNKEESMHIH